MNYKQKTAENITYQALSIYCATLPLLDFAVSGYTYIICIKNRELLALLNGAFAIANYPIYSAQPTAKTHHTYRTIAYVHVYSVANKTLKL